MESACGGVKRRTIRLVVVWMWWCWKLPARTPGAITGRPNCCAAKSMDVTYSTSHARAGQGGIGSFQCPLSDGGPECARPRAQQREKVGGLR